MSDPRVATYYSSAELIELFDQSWVLFDDGDYRVISLEGPLAARWWGRDSRWCTIDPIWFETYRQTGELIFIQERRTGRRWQFHLHSCELRSARNRRADGPTFARDHPAVMGAMRSWFQRDFRARFFFGLASEGEKVGHSLNLRSVRLKSLPSKLWVRDDLDVSDTGIKVLPEGLRVGGDLYVSDYPLPTMPSDFTIKGVRHIRSKRLQNLPESAFELDPESTFDSTSSAESSFRGEVE